MTELETIQKRETLNTPIVADEPHPTNAGHHRYLIQLTDSDMDDVVIQFQNGPRNEPGSIRGVLDGDLLEIVRHRIASFQKGPYSTRENAIALTHIEEALLWMNKRVEDRIARGVMGTNQK